MVTQSNGPTDAPDNRSLLNREGGSSAKHLSKDLPPLSSPDVGTAAAFRILTENASSVLLQEALTPSLPKSKLPPSQNIGTVKRVSINSSINDVLQVLDSYAQDSPRVIYHTRFEQ